MLGLDFHGLETITGGDYVVAERVEHSAHQLQKRRIILDEQDRLTLAMVNLFHFGDDNMRVTVDSR